MSFFSFILLGILGYVAYSHLKKLKARQNQFEIEITNRLTEIESRLPDKKPPSKKTKPKENPKDIISEKVVPPTPDTNTDPADTSGEDKAEQERLREKFGLAKGTAKKSSKTSTLDLEKLIGGRWAVLLGGLALGLGLIFLVKHTIEAGLLGPAARVFLGFALSTAAFAAGEWLRRNDKKLALPLHEKADIPGILTGVGAIGLFATLYAAHALYGFIGPATAFISLAIIGIVTILLSSIHGSKLAALGALGGYITPLLISSNTPNAIALALHVLVLTAVIMATARIRKWTWLATSGIIGSGIWLVLTSEINAGNSGIAGLILIFGLAVIFLLTIVTPDEIHAEVEDKTIPPLAPFAFGILVLGYVAHLLVNQDLPVMITAFTTSVLIMAASYFITSLAPLSILVCIIILVTVATNDLPFDIQKGLVTTEDLQSGLIPRDISGFITNALILALPSALIAFWGTRKTSLKAPIASGWLSASVNIIAFFGLLVIYLRLAPFETKPLIGVIALGVAGLLTAATEYFIRQEPENLKAPSVAAFAVGAISVTSFAITISIDVGWMPLAFALTALGIVYVYMKRAVTILPYLSMSAAIICGICLFANMPLELPKVSSTLIFNQLLLLLALPAAALIISGELLRRKEAANQLPEVAITSIGLGVLALFIGLEVTHLINGGNLASSRQSLAETAGHALAAMGMAIGLQRAWKSSNNEIYSNASLIAGIVSVIISAFGLLLAYNPYFEKQLVGDGIILNLLLPAYLLTGLASGVVAYLARPVRPRWYTLMYAALSGTLIFSYFSLMLRKAFQGDNLHHWSYTSDLEFLLYSPLWLVLGGVVLAAGIFFKSLPIRAASGIIIFIVTIKVFLLDLSELTGVLRAFSFIGLGLTLIMIGRVYQRLLIGGQNQESEIDSENT